MKTRMVEERVGEDLGPVDWSHPWIAEMEADANWRAGILIRIREYTRATAAGEPDEWVATDDGGCPKIGYGKVLDAVMYDGWPYWTPHPVLLVSQWYGVQRIPFRNVADIRRKT